MVVLKGQDKHGCQNREKIIEGLGFSVTEFSRRKFASDSKTLVQSRCMRQLSSTEEEALAAFKEQRLKLDSIVDKDVRATAFISWKTQTIELFDRYLQNLHFALGSLTPVSSVL